MDPKNRVTAVFYDYIASLDDPVAALAATAPKAVDKVDLALSHPAALFATAARTASYLCAFLELPDKRAFVTDH